MAESLSPDPRPREEVQKMVHAVAQLLREAPALGKEAQESLADLVDELGTLLEATPVPSAEVTHLSQSVAHLVEAAHRPQQHGLLATARARVDKAIVAAESEAPLAAGLARRVVDALSNIGI